MTVIAVDADKATHPGSGSRPFLWVAMPTVVWLALNYWLPVIQASGAPTIAARMAIHVLIALGLWLALERTELTPSQRRGFWLTIMIPFTLWLAVIWGGAINGIYRPGANPLLAALLPLSIFLPVIVGVPILLRSRRMGQVLDAMPAHWLIALQAYRVLGGIFLVGWASSVVPGIFALPAGVGDVTTGLLALPVAIALAAGQSDRRAAAIAWNIFGICDLALAVAIGISISPGPLQWIVPSVPNVAIALYPTVMTPAFAVPSSIMLHALSLRQLRRREKRAAAAGSTASSGQLSAAA